MRRVDAHQVYRLGQTLSRLSKIEYWDFAGETTSVSAAADIYIRCSHEFAAFLDLNPFNLKISLRSGQNLLNAINTALQICRSEEDKEKKITYEIGSPVVNRLRDFEVLLRAEMADLNIYLVDQKQAFDTATIVFRGENAFPERLVELGDSVIEDARSAMRCIAFELPTAAAFHLHRLNESVLGLYWDAVIGSPRPKSQTLGSYLAELRKLPNADKPLIAALDQIRELHRNPTVHADYTFSKVGEAIALFGIVSSAIGYMLAAMPPKEKEPQGVSSLFGAIPPAAF